MSRARACPQCGHLSENAKDWRNPVFGRVYGALAMADRKASNNDLLDWLNSNGFANLTCCPECHVDDFTHVEGCRIAANLDQGVA